MFLAGLGFISGVINAVAGGGSLLVFPALMATGMPPLLANVTNSVAQAPGFVGAVLGQRTDLGGPAVRFWAITIACVVGSVIGSVLLMVLPGAVFEAVVPILVGLAAVLMAMQDRIKGWLGTLGDDAPDRILLLTAGFFLASIYGGYFGGARSVIFLVILTLAASDTVRRLTALKSWTGLVGSAVTVAVLAVIAPVQWWSVLLLVPTTLVGGFVGGRLARRLPAKVLRWTIVVIAGAVALYLGADVLGLI